MRRRELQHVILEIGERFGLTEVFVIGSSAILAVLPNPPEGVLTATRDVDIIPPHDEDERMADRISFVIGEARRRAEILISPTSVSGIGVSGFCASMMSGSGEYSPTCRVGPDGIVP